MLTFSRDPEVAEQQMNAIIFYLTAFGYIDGDFDLSEKTFVRNYIQQLVEKRANDAMPDAEASVLAEVVQRFVTHFHEIFERVDLDVRGLFDETVADGEKVEGYVYAKLKLRAYEIFKSFDKDNQMALLKTVEELIYADGQVHPSEAKFRDEVRFLLDAKQGPIDPIDAEAAANIEIGEPASLALAADNHPFFTRHEHHYSADPERILKQAEGDRQLIQRTMTQLDKLREGNDARLAGHQKVGEFANQEPFMDGHLCVHPLMDGQRYELVVLGDLHGCYSCLKAAIMQANFFAKVEAYRLDPRNNPNPKLVLLGDYIDRGKFSYNGVLRTVMQLFLTAPEHVYPLRGNHEYYLEYRGRIYGGVRPAEAINSLVGHMPDDMFVSYMELFESLPNVLFFGDTMFVHAGIPREADLRERHKDLSSLNDPELRFQMLWSDPSQADYIPDELQAQNARFPFGRKQFEAFMSSIGCSTMIRGHEKVTGGFRTVYAGGAATLVNIFSAGGRNNNDLPVDSSYRSVKPMALTINVEDGVTKITPWEIDYEKFNDPDRNAFFAKPPEIEHKA